METGIKKSFINNTLFNVIYKISNVIFPLIISIYTSRVLLPDGNVTLRHQQKAA